jgi:hypothetical protein
MSVALLDRRRQRPPWGAEAGMWGGQSRPATVDVGRTSLSTGGAHGARTLDELVTGAWEELVIREVVHCPVCNGRMRSQVAAPGDARLGDCLDCGARLS